MVRIQCRISRKWYLGSKQVYEYERMSLHIPHKFHSKVKPFLKQDLDMQVTTKDDYLVITLTSVKTRAGEFNNCGKTGFNSHFMI